MCQDNDSHLFITWYGLTPQVGFNIFGELFDSLGTVIGTIIGLMVGLGGGYVIRLLLSNYSAESMEKKAKQLLKDAKREAETLLKESEVRAKADALKAREDFEASTQAQKKELAVLEERIFQRETNLDRKVSMIDKKEQALDAKTAELEQQMTSLKAERVQLEKLTAEEREKIQQIAKMSQEEAKKILLTRVEKEVHGEMGGLLRRLQEEAKETAQREAQKIVAVAVQRYALSHANELMTTTVTLPGDDMKGRIIGRDGRNIRALEAATGINVLIDDTPDSVVISGFDPVRREIARKALEHLIADGRIHPARIEEIVAKVQENMKETIRLAGDEAASWTARVPIPPSSCLRWLLCDHRLRCTGCSRSSAYRTV